MIPLNVWDVVESVGFVDETLLGAVGDGSLTGMEPVEPVTVPVDGKGRLDIVSESIDWEDSVARDAELLRS